MSVIIITYDAKCKHCKHFTRHLISMRAFHKCNLTQEPLTLKSKPCKNFEL